MSWRPYFFPVAVLCQGCCDATWTNYREKMLLLDEIKAIRRLVRMSLLQCITIGRLVRCLLVRKVVSSTVPCDKNLLFFSELA
jgi:hypothetical protein